MPQVLGKKRPAGPTSTAMKYRPVDACRSNAKGTKPLADAASVSHVLVMMIVHLARKIMYGIDLPLKVGIYIVGTLILSLIGDFGKEGSNFFAQSDNFLNAYFVKWSWGWTLLLVGPFVAVTGYTTGCGQKEQLRAQALRLALATGIWYFGTGLFLTIEDNSGICNVTKFLRKSDCLKNGFRWKGFDISGHTFLLTFANLFILEEGKAYLGWERIKDMLRNEEHKRLSVDLPSTSDPDAKSTESTALSKLTCDEFVHLRNNYAKLTPYVRALFCSLSLLVFLWDLMLFCTILYFHIMIEKVVASCIAVLLWFVLYRGLYTTGWSTLLSPPGFEGPFKYVTYKSKSEKLCKKESLNRGRPTETRKGGRTDEVPKFMGMPLYGYPKAAPAQQQPADDEQLVNGKVINDAPVSLKNSRSRSTSRLRGSSRSSLNLKYL